MFEFFIYALGLLIMFFLWAVCSAIKDNNRRKLDKRWREYYQKTDEYKRQEWDSLKDVDRMRDRMPCFHEGVHFYRDLPEDLRADAARKLDFSYKKLGYFDWSNIDNNKEGK